MHALFETSPNSPDQADSDRPLVVRSAVGQQDGDRGGPGAGSSHARGGDHHGRGGRRRSDPEILLEGLNDPQAAAVTHSGSPLLIVAGAGSGKTRVLTHRIAYLLAARDVHPGEIIAITFTNKAAGEMKERVAALVGPRARLMWVSTFHSACVRILRAEHEHAGLKSTFSIYDADDSRRLMQLVARELDLDPKRYSARSLAAPVSNLKNELVDPETFAARARRGRTSGRVAEAYALYQRRLREAHALDFDDLIMTTVHLLQSHPGVAENYRRRFRHVLVDEYQDTNHAQYMLVKELVGGDELDAAGRAVRGRRRRPVDLRVPRRDDPQHPGVRARLPDARTILLEQNYRSTQTILSAANAVIDRNTERKPKRLWSDQGDGEQIVGYVADTEHAEADWVAREIDRLTDAGEVRPADVAVFYRTNAQSRVFEEVFIRVGLPYKVVGGVRFYERKEVRDALAYLRAIANDDDTVSVRRILNTPRRGIGDRAEACVEALSSRDRISFGAALRRAGDAPGIAPRSANAIADFVAMLDELRDVVRDARRPRRCWRRCWRGPGCSPSWRRASTRRTTAGWRTCRSWSASPASTPSGSTRRRRSTRTPARYRRRAGRAADPGRLPGAGGAGRRRRPDSQRRPGPPGCGHADDAAHREGPGVPGRVPDRPGGRRLPAPALARRRPGAGGGAPARVRRHHPCPPAALHVARGDPRRLGTAAVQPGVAVPRRAARAAGALGADRERVHVVVRDRWRRRWTGRRHRRANEPVSPAARREGGRDRVSGSASRRASLATASELAKPDVPTLVAGDRVNHQRYGLGRVVAVQGAGRPRAGADRLRRPDDVDRAAARADRKDVTWRVDRRRQAIGCGGKLSAA